MKAITFEAGRSLNLPDLKQTCTASRTKLVKVWTKFKTFCRARERELVAVGAISGAACFISSLVEGAEIWTATFAVVWMLALGASEFVGKEVTE